MNAHTADIFEMPAIARKRDPETSKIAAEKHNRTKRKNDREMMYDLIFENPGLTAAEYSDLLRQRGTNWYRAARLPTKRISDLLDAGRLNVGFTRQCSVTGDKARTYYAQPA